MPKSVRAQKALMMPLGNLLLRVFNLLTYNLRNMKFKLSDGLRYCYNNNGEKVCTGAAMGRRNILPDNPELPIKLHLEKLAMSCEGVYDNKGAYWGYGKTLYVAYAEGVEIYTRASSREEAKGIIIELVKGARFFK